MTIKLQMVTFDCRDPHALAEWWARQTGGQAEGSFEDTFVVVSVPGVPQKLGFQRVPDPTPGKNKLHLDVTAENRELEVERLLAEGAIEVARHEMSEFTWVVLADPEGNQFCVGQG